MSEIEIKDGKAYHTDMFVAEDMYQCPYCHATQCAMTEPCKGCEEWAAAGGVPDTPEGTTKTDKGE